MKRSPLRSKRATPRVSRPERVQCGRIKPRTVEPTAEQQRFHDWLRAKGRCQAGGTGDLVVHHILARCPGKVGRRDHWFVVLISAALHNGRSDSVHGMGSEAKFARVHGVDLVAIAQRNFEQWQIA